MAATASLHQAMAFHSPYTHEPFQGGPAVPKDPASISHQAEYYSRGDTIANLNYIQLPTTDGSKPFNYVETPPPGTPQRNFTTSTISTPIHDIRGHESEYTLDHDAFRVVSSLPPSTTDFSSDSSIRQTYYPECETLLLKEVPGASKVVIFDHTIRRTSPSAPRGPVNQVHIDQTPSSALQRVYLHLGDEAEDFIFPKKRVRIINVWRPINGTVVSNPLAFCSSASVRNEDVFPVEHRYPERTGETAGVRWNERQKWCYVSGVKEDESILLECFDSEGGKDTGTVRGGRAPHTAFGHSGEMERAKGRESIEVRALVFSEGEG